jgi:hypothetical protein
MPLIAVILAVLTSWFIATNQGPQAQRPTSFGTQNPNPPLLDISYGGGG